jgi:hypothetical protein
MLTRKAEGTYFSCESNKHLDYVIYFETYFAIMVYLSGLILAGVTHYQYHKQIQHKKTYTLNSIPFTSITRWIQSDRKCCICIDDFSNDDILANIKCGHYDHLDCMNEWIRKSLCCPRCKSDL